MSTVRPRFGFLGGRPRTSDEKETLPRDKKENPVTAANEKRLERSSSSGALSDTSVTSASASSSRDLLAVFKKKKKIPSNSSEVDDKDVIGNPFVTSSKVQDVIGNPFGSYSQVQDVKGNPFATANAKSKGTDYSPITGTSSTDCASQPRKDLWQWHEMLVQAEAVRRASVQNKLDGNLQEYEAIRQLVADALQETAAACRWTTGIARAQEQLAQALTLPALKTPDDDDDNDLSIRKGGGDDLVTSVTDEDSLPEKLKGAVDEEEDNETAAGALPGSVTGHEVVAAVAVTTTTPTKKLMGRNRETPPTACNDGSQPPVFSISFPNPEASEEAFYVLHKQHDVLQQTFARSVPHASIEKAQMIKELCTEHVNKLDELAGGILKELQSDERELQKLWDAYFTAAEEVLAVTPKTATASAGGSEAVDASTTTSKGKKVSMGDVWVAELTYRSAVSRQAADWAERELTVQSLFEMVKDGERQRRLKLRKHLQVSVLQKHAAAFKRVQQAHAEALESWIQHAVDGESGDEADNRAVDAIKTAESSSGESANHHDVNGTTKENRLHAAAGKPVLSSKERIRHIANFAGATTVWDDDEKLESGEARDRAMAYVASTVSPGVEATTTDYVDEADSCGNVDMVAEFGGIDVDMYMDLSSDEDDLPLLANALGLPAKTTSKPNPPTGGRTSNKSPEVVARRDWRMKGGALIKSKAKGKKRDESTNKINNVVVLDQSSTTNAYFMDRLLYSASLLESHYVKFAVVARIEHDLLRSTSTAVGETKIAEELEGTEDDDATPMTVLVVVTWDQALHLFEVPLASSISACDALNSDQPTVTKQDAIVPGSPPDDALRSLLSELEAADLQLKQQAQTMLKLKDAPVSPSKLSFRRNKPVQEERKCFQFSSLSPSLSVPLCECTVRLNKRGENAVKISPKNRNSRLYSSKLSFASLDDQQAFVEASLGQFSPLAA